jgi:hypothetical protein
MFCKLRLFSLLLSFVCCCVLELLWSTDEKLCIIYGLSKAVVVCCEREKRKSERAAREKKVSEGRKWHPCISYTCKELSSVRGTDTRGKTRRGRWYTGRYTDKSSCCLVLCTIYIIFLSSEFATIKNTIRALLIKMFENSYLFIICQPITKMIYFVAHKYSIDLHNIINVNL